MFNAFSGLPAPKSDQTEEMLVESMMHLVGLPRTSIRTAVRLPLKSKGRSLVLVEMDTMHHEDKIIKAKADIKKFFRYTVHTNARTRVAFLRISL